MRKWFIRAAALFCFFAALLGIAAPAEASRKTVAVMPIESISRSMDARYAAETMTEELTNVLANSGRFEVVERSQLGTVTKEMGFGQTGLVDPATAAEIGKMAGAQYILVGKVTMADVFRSQVPILGIKTMKGRIGLEYRLIDGETGRILLSSSLTDSHTVDEITGSDFSQQVILNKTCRDAAEKVLEEIQRKNPLTGMVLDADGKTIYLDLGLDSGIKEGEKLLVYREGKPILGRQGELIAARIIELGKVEIDEIYDNYSIGHLTDRKGPVARGDLVRRESR